MFTCGIIYDKTKYIEYTQDTKHMRWLSIEDQFYCILIEITLNANTVKVASEANNIQHKLTNNILFPRPENFTYVNLLSDKKCLSSINKWFKKIDATQFDFEEIAAIYDCSNDLDNYLEFDKWLIELEDFKKVLLNREASLNKIECEQICKLK